MTLFVWGGCAVASAVAALFFWRFFRDTRDRLFAMFSLAFFTLGAHWAALASLAPGEETRHYFYVLRLIAFLLILAAVIDKNRNRSPR
jgi:heme A synthase